MEEKKNNKGTAIIAFLGILIITLVIAIAMFLISAFGTESPEDMWEDDEDDYAHGVVITATPVPDHASPNDGNSTAPETDADYGTWYEDVKEEVIETFSLTGIKAFDDKIEDYKSLRHKSEAQRSQIVIDKKLNESYYMFCDMLYGLDPGFKFGLYDFDSNGTMDLVISASGEVVDVYSYKEGKIYKIAPNISNGRSNLYILSGGRFLYFGSNSAFDCWYRLYQVNNAGTGVTEVDSYSYYDEGIFGGGANYGSAEVFSQKYNALCKQIITLNNINWTEF